MHYHHHKVNPRRHFFNAAWLTMSGAAAKLLLLLASILTYKHLSVPDNGLLGFALAYGSICALVMEAGLRGYTVREISRRRDDHGSAAQLFSLTLSTRAAVFLLAGPIVLLIAWMMGYRGALLAFVAAMVAYALLDSVALYLKAVLRCYDRMGLDAAFSVLAKILLLLVLVVSVYRNGLDLPTVSAAYVSSAFLEVAGLVIVVGTRLRLPFARVCAPRDMYQLLRTSLPFASIAIIAILYLRTGALALSGLPWLQSVLGQFGLLASNHSSNTTSLAAVAYFTTAARLPEALSFLPLAVVNALIPYLSRNKGQPVAVQATFSILLKYLGASGFMLGAWLATQPASFLMLISKAEYLPATNALILMALALPFSFLHYTTSNFLLCLDEEKVLIRRELLGLFLNLALNVALVPFWTYTGAAAALMISEIACVLMHLRVLKVRNRIQLPGKLVLFWVLAGASVVLPGYLVQGLSPLPSLIPGALGAIVCIAIIALSNTSELRALRQRDAGG